MTSVSVKGQECRQDTYFLLLFVRGILRWPSLTAVRQGKRVPSTDILYTSFSVRISLTAVRHKGQECRQDTYFVLLFVRGILRWLYP